MPQKTKRNNRTRKNKTRRGGMLKAALAAAALATGAQGKSALGQGVTPRGVGPYGMNKPAPSRNVAGLSVMPVNGTPSYMANRAFPKGPLFPKNLANYKGWPNAGSTYVANNWSKHLEGTRYTSEPEVQTWNPYLRGDPEEVVDYYEGFSNNDKATRMATNGDGGKVKRKNTPMWKAAMRHSSKLPSVETSKNISEWKWQKWAEEGRKLGMNIPLNDPRTAATPNVNWANAPHVTPSWFLDEQLYHHGELPKQNFWGQPKMKGSVSAPEPNWAGSNLGKKRGPQTEYQAEMGNKYRGPNTGI
jgi:hypothetical protein